MSKVDGLIISDTKSSAISTSSRVWAEKLNADLIYALDYSSLAKLIEVIDQKYTWVLFSWRGSLEAILNDRFFTSRLNKVCSKTTLFFSVPDHLDLANEKRLQASPIYKYADGFTVVSRRLEASYKLIEGLRIASVFLPDFPNIKLLNEVEGLHETKDVHAVIWVGNSRWGKTLGIEDHKGYFSKFVKIVQSAMDGGTALKFKAIDRAQAFLPHRMTLIEIARSSFLLQTSKSEGTGLPVLEALALGTYPITTDVGINREVFGSRWNEFHAETPAEFLQLLQPAKVVTDPVELKNIYSQYISQSSAYVANFSFPTKDDLPRLDTLRQKYLKELGIDLTGRLRWTVRFLLNKWRAINQEKCIS